MLIANARPKVGSPSRTSNGRSDLAGSPSRGRCSRQRWQWWSWPWESRSTSRAVADSVMPRNVPASKKEGPDPQGSGDALLVGLAAVHAAPDRHRCDPVVAHVLVALDLDPGQLVVVRPLQKVHELVLDRVAVVHADVLALLLVDDLELERVVRHRATLTGMAFTIALILAILFTPW